MKRCLLPLLLATACTTIEYFDDADGTSTRGSEESSSTTTGLLPTGVGPPVTTSSSSTGSSGGTSTGVAADESGPDNCNFLGCEPYPDAPPQCDPMLQDCPRGQKCNIYSNDGGSAYNAARCVPLDDDPDLPDESCTFEDWPLSGLDSCAAGSVCAWVDVDTGLGVCQPMCEGRANAPGCADEDRVCRIGGDAIPAFCMKACSPLEDDCPAGLACYLQWQPYVCSGDFSEPDAAALDECDYANQCPAGTACAVADTVGVCPDGAERCCASFCDLQAPDCPTPLNCAPYFGEAPAPEGLESVGLCVLP